MIRFLIKEIRKKQDVTLKYLNFQTKISMSYLSEIENNKEMNPSFYKIIKVAKALDLKVDELFYDTGDISSLKKALDLYVDCYGINHSKVLELTKEIDEIVIKVYSKKNS